MSTQFNASYYLQNNPDVVVAIAQGIFRDAADHYNRFGAKELRNPNAIFDAKYYAAQNADVLNAVSRGVFSSVYAHYLAAGATEGRVPNAAFANFDADRYLVDNADVKAAGITSAAAALKHFVEYGVDEGRSAFDKGGSPITINNSGNNTAYTLTNGTDIATANVFTAGLVYTPGGNDRINALQDEDVLTGTGTNPTLNATIGNPNDNGAATITPKLNGVETLNFAFTGSAGTNTIDVQDATGVKAVNVTRITQDQSVTIRNLTTVPANLSLSNTNSTNGTVQFTFTDAAARGAADSTNLTVTDVSVGSLVIQEQSNTGTVGDPLLDQGVETLTITAKGSNLITSLTAEDLKTLNITGAGNLTLLGENNAAGSLTKVDASTLTGNLDIRVSQGIIGAVPDGKSNGDVAFSLTAGTGNDRVRLRDTVGTNDTIAAGAGTDTLRFEAQTTGNYETIAENIVSGKVVPQVTGVETIQLRNTGSGGVASTTIGLRADHAEGDQTILLQNVTYNGDGGTADGITIYNVVNLSATEATNVSIAHSGGETIGLLPASSSNGITQNIVNLDVASGSSAALTITEGQNTDPRFNLEVYTDSDLTLGSDASLSSTGVGVRNVSTLAAGNGVTSFTLNDTDATESNTVFLAARGYNGSATLADAGTAYRGAGSTVTLTGGATGNFLNLDATFNANASFSGGYGLNNTGASSDFVSTAAVSVDSAVAVGTVVGNASYRFLSNGYGTVDGVADNARVVRLTAENIAAGAFAGDVIVRLGDITRGDGISSQSVTTNTGNDTIIFDAQSNVTAGYTSGDTVTAGTGWDTLVIDGNNSTSRISIQKSEWDNTKGIDALRIAGNQGYTNVGNGDIVSLPAGSFYSDNVAQTIRGGYYVEIDNEFVAQTDAKNGLVIVSNDGDLGSNNESDLVLNLRPLSQTSSVNFIGSNGNAASAAGNASNRLQVEDNSVNSGQKLDGGDTSTSDITVSSGNNNVLQVYNTATVSINDLSQTKNFGRIEGTNDLAVAQTLNLELNSTIVDQLVDAGTSASGSNVERLTVVAQNNTNVANAVENLNIAASAVGSSFGLDILTDRGSINTIVGSSGTDHVILLGNYTAAEAATFGGAFAGAGFTGVNGSSNYANTFDQADVTARANAVTQGTQLVYATQTFTGVERVETFGGTDLSNVSLGGAELVIHSNVTLKASQYASLKSVTSTGTGSHTLTIVDDSSTANTLDLSKITSNLGTLNVDTLKATTGTTYSQSTNGTSATSNGGSVIVNGSATSAPTATLAVSPASVAEGSALTYTVTLSSAATTDTTVKYTTGGTATSGTDYTAPSGSLVIKAGATTGTVTVTTLNDALTTEGTETVSLSLASGTGYNLGSTTSVTGSITDGAAGSTIVIPTASTGSVAGTAAADTFTFALATAQATATDTQVQVTGFSTAADRLQLSLAAANPAVSGTTLAQLSGDLLANGSAIGVQTNVITGNTLVTFGLDSDGTVIAVTLVGVTDASAVQVTLV